MLNQVVLVGRLTKDPEVKKVEGDKSVSTITLAVQRTFKNAAGVYDTDFIDITIWDRMAQNTQEYCKKGDIVGVKGKLQLDTFENKKGEKVSKLNVIGEKVTFLSSKKEEPQQDNQDR